MTGRTTCTEMTPTATRLQSIGIHSRRRRYCRIRLVYLAGHATGPFDHSSRTAAHSRTGCLSSHAELVTFGISHHHVVSLESIQYARTACEQPVHLDQHSRPLLFRRAVSRHTQIEVQTILRHLRFRNLQQTQPRSYTRRIMQPCTPHPIVTVTAKTGQPLFSTRKWLWSRLIDIPRSQLPKRRQTIRVRAIHREINSGKHPSMLLPPTIEVALRKSVPRVVSGRSVWHWPDEIPPAASLKISPPHARSRHPRASADLAPPRIAHGEEISPHERLHARTVPSNCAPRHSAFLQKQLRSASTGSSNSEDGPLAGGAPTFRGLGAPPASGFGRGEISDQTCATCRATSLGRGQTTGEPSRQLTTSQSFQNNGFRASSLI